MLSHDLKYKLAALWCKKLFKVFAKILRIKKEKTKLTNMFIQNLIIYEILTIFFFFLNRIASVEPKSKYLDFFDARCLIYFMDINIKDISK